MLAKSFKQICEAIYFPGYYLKFLRTFWVEAETYQNPDEYLGWSFFSKTANVWYPLTIFSKTLILDIRLGSEYVPGKFKFFKFPERELLHSR